jgi:hypothetical protein
VHLSKPWEEYGGGAVSDWLDESGWEKRVSKDRVQRNVNRCSTSVLWLHKYQDGRKHSQGSLVLE